MSFLLTQTQMYLGQKFVTRRIGWNFLTRQTVVNAVEKNQGIGKGNKVKRIGQIEILSIEAEPLQRLLEDDGYGKKEMVREGFPDRNPKDFVNWFCGFNEISPHKPVNRILFMPLYIIPDVWACPNCNYRITHTTFVLSNADYGCQCKTPYAMFKPVLLYTKPFSDKFPFVANIWERP